MGMGSQKQSQDSTQTRTVPPWLTEGQQNMVGILQNMTGPFIDLPTYRTAGFTPDQTNAFDLARTMAMNTFTNPSQMVDTNAIRVPGGAGQTRAASSTAAQLDPASIAQFQNPYTQQVVDTTLTNLRRDRAQQEAEIGARAAAAGSYGGSREAVQRSLLNRNYNQTAQQLVASLMSSGYDRATATAMANTQMRQQTGESNAAREQQAGLSNAQLGQQGAQFNVSAGLQAPALNSQLATADQQRQLQALQTLLGTGGAQQQLAQQNLNIPWTTLQMLTNTLAPTLNNTDSTQTGHSTSTTSGSGGAMQMIGMAGSLLCHAAGTPIVMEDGSTKNVEDIRIGDRVFMGGEVMGRGEGRGRDIYAYRGTKLTGTHAVFENGKFIRVADSKVAERQDMDGTLIYPLMTERHLLVTPNYICADFAETDDVDVRPSERLARLNGDRELMRYLVTAERDLFLSDAA